MFLQIYSHSNRQTLNYAHVIVLTIILTQLAQMINANKMRRYFDCPPCDYSKCEKPRGCEIVPGPGACWCCYTCARQEGDNCGVYTERCGRGMQCKPKYGENEPLSALFRGDGVCMKVIWPWMGSNGSHSKIKGFHRSRSSKRSSSALLEAMLHNRQYSSDETSS